MRKILRILFLFMIAIFLTANSVNATLIGLNLDNPDIFSDTSGTYSYNSATDEFTFSATALTIFDGTTLFTITGGDYDVSFYVDSAGNFSGGVSGDDLVIIGTVTYGGTTYSGVLLTGEVTDFGWLDGPSDTTYAYFDFTFDVTGGLLASYFFDLGGDFSSSEKSNFTGKWTVNHSGTKTKHNTARIPEPSTLLLLGTGLIGIGVYRWRRMRKQK